MDPLTTLGSVAILLAVTGAIWLGIGRVRLKRLAVSPPDFRTIADHSRDVIMIVGKDRRCTYINPAIEVTTGLGASSFIGKRLESFPVSPDVLKEWDQTFTSILRSKKPEAVVFDFPGRDGDLSVQAQAIPTFNTDGSIESLLVIARDISDKKMTTLALAASEDKYRGVFEASKDAILLVDRDSMQIMDANQAAERAYRYSRQELLQLKISDLSTDALACAETIRSGRVENLFRRHKRKDGSLFSVEVTASPFRSGLREMMAIAIRDATDRQAVEMAIRTSELRYRLFADAATEGIIIHDGQRVLDANDAATKLIGYSREEIIESNLLTFAAPESHPTIIQHIKTQSEDPYQAIGLKKDGSRFPVEILARTVTHQGETVRVVVLRDQTERRLTEQALRSSEEKFLKAFRSTPDSITISTLKEGKFLDVNDGFTKISGYTREEAVGKTSEALRIWANLDDRTKMVELLQRNGRIANLETTIRIKSGAIIHCLISAEIIEVEGEQCLVGVTRDVTSEREALIALEESRAMLSVILDTIPIRVFWKDRDSRYLGCNLLFAEDAGLTSPRDIVGVTDRELVWKEHAEIYEKADREVLESGRGKMNFEEEVRVNSNKELRWVRTSKVPLLDPRGTLVGVMGCYEDITEERKADEALRTSETALRESEARFRALAESTSAVIMIFRGESMLYVNPAGQELIGCSLEEIESMKFWEIIDPEYRDLVKERGLARQRGEQVPDRYEVKVIARNGERRWIDFGGRTIEFEGAPAVIGTAVDITERKEAEEKIGLLNEELERRVKARTSALEASNRELESFSYSVSHDLRSPLRAIQGFAGILMEDHAAQLDKEAKRVLNVIQANTTKMGNLIDDLLAFSRLGRSHMAKERIHMYSLVREVIDELSVGAKTVPTVQVHDLADIEGDRSMIKQVMFNLLSNSIKFCSKSAAPTIEITSELTKDEVIFSVKDNGVGFDMEFARKVFGVFQRLHREDEFPGTGVGLALVQRIIERHGGRVWARGAVDEGATFFFTIPIRPIIDT